MSYLVNLCKSNYCWMKMSAKNESGHIGSIFEKLVKQSKVTKVTKLNLIFIRNVFNNSVSSLFTWKIKLNSIPKDSKRSLKMILVPSIRRIFDVTSRVFQTSKIQNWLKRWNSILFQPSLVSDAALHLSPLADRWKHHWKHVHHNYHDYHMQFIKITGRAVAVVTQ